MEKACVTPRWLNLIDLFISGPVYLPTIPPKLPILLHRGRM